MKIELTVEELKKLVKITPVGATTDVYTFFDGEKIISQESHEGQKNV